MIKKFELFKEIIDHNLQAIHVIDVDSMEILYANKASMNNSAYPSMSYEGRKCYKYFFDRYEQCEECPLKHLSNNSDFMKKKGDKLEQVHTEIFDWDGKKVYVEYIEDVTKISEASKENKRRLEIISALSSDYLNVYSIDPHTGSTKIIKLDGYVVEGMEKHENLIYDFDIMSRRYIKNRVHPEDVEMMIKVLSIENLQKELKDKDIYSGTYRVIDEGEMHYYMYKFIKNSDSDKYIAGFQNIDSIINKEIEHKKEIEKKNAELTKANDDRDKQLEILTSMSEMYYSMHYIDLKANTVVEYSTAKDIMPYVNSYENAYYQMNEVMKHRAHPDYVDEVMSFVNFDTLGKRLKGKKIISMDFLDIDNIWFRANFIAIGVEEDGCVDSVIFTTRIIDEESVERRV